MTLQEAIQFCLERVRRNPILGVAHLVGDIATGNFYSIRNKDALSTWPSEYKVVATFHPAPIRLK